VRLLTVTIEVADSIEFRLSFVDSCNGSEWQWFDTALGCSWGMHARLQLRAARGWTACKSLL